MDCTLKMFSLLEMGHQWFPFSKLQKGCATVWLSWNVFLQRTIREDMLGTIWIREGTLKNVAGDWMLHLSVAISQVEEEQKHLFHQKKPIFNYKWSIESTPWILNYPADQWVSMLNHGIKRWKEEAQLSEVEVKKERLFGGHSSDLTHKENTLIHCCCWWWWW